jgi:hypothetical protein
MNLLKQDKDTSYWSEVIASLAEKSEKILSEMECTNLERKIYQLDASLGDMQAKEALRNITNQINSLKTHHEDTLGAIEQANTKLEEAKQEEQKAANKQKAAHIKSLMSQVMETSEKIDLAMAVVAKGRQDQQRLLQEIGVECDVRSLGWYLRTCNGESFMRVLQHHLPEVFKDLNTYYYGKPISVTMQLNEQFCRMVSSIIEGLETDN